jgi:hypothetical protein
LADESSAEPAAAPPQATNAATPGVSATAASLEPSLPAPHEDGCPDPFFGCWCSLLEYDADGRPIEPASLAQPAEATGSNPATVQVRPLGLAPLFDVPTTWEELSDLTTPEDLVGVSSEDIARMRD